MKKSSIRQFTKKEKEILSAKLSDKTLSAYVLDRYRIVQATSEKFTPTSISRILGCERVTVYHWIRKFNESGFYEFEKVTNPNGRPAILTSENVRQLVKAALSRPSDLGLPYTQWSVAKLSTYCKSKSLLPDVSNEWLRRLLAREGLSLQRTKTWKVSPDTEFEKKKPHSKAVPQASTK
jgi:transposase